MKKISKILLILAGLSIFWSNASAQEVEGKKSFVYGVNSYSPTEKIYLGTFIPDQVETIYILEGRTTILSPRVTEVYFWPITNNYKADWNSLNKSVTGTLEIYSSGNLISKLDITDYVIQYPQGMDYGEVALYTGAEASHMRMEFETAQEAYRESLWEYNEARRVYESLPEDSRNSLPEPIKPDSFMLSSTNVNKGFPIDLPKGTYNIRVVDESGSVVEASEKTLVVFSHRREATGYVIVPEEKYVTPERSPEPDQYIYRKQNSILYMLPFIVREYNEIDITRFGDPQSIAGRKDQWVWVYIEPINGDQIELSSGNELISVIERKPYWVEQIPGPTLGYRILDSIEDLTVASRTPDFEGFRIDLANSQTDIKLRIIGDDIEPGTRNLRTVKVENANLLYAVLVLPLAARYLLVFLFKKP